MRRGFLNSGGSTKPPPAPKSPPAPSRQAAPPPAPKQAAAQSSAEEADAFVQRIVDAAYAGGFDALREEILRLDAASDATFGTWVIRGGLDALASDPRPGDARDRYTALCAVALGGDPACVQLLLHPPACERSIAAASTDVCLQNWNWKTPGALESTYPPLVVAGIQGHVGVIDALLNAGVYINQRASSDVEGVTALHMATRYVRLEAVEMLLRRGADVHAKTVGDGSQLMNSPLTYLVMATSAPGDDVSGTVLETPEVSEDASAPDDRRAVAQALLAAGADPHAPLLLPSGKPKHNVGSLVGQAVAIQHLPLFEALATHRCPPGELSRAVLGDPQGKRPAGKKRPAPDARYLELTSLAKHEVELAEQLCDYDDESDDSEDPNRASLEDARAILKMIRRLGTQGKEPRGKPPTRAARPRRTAPVRASSTPSEAAPQTCHECGAPVVDDGELVGPCRRCGKSFCSRKCEHKGWRPGGFGCSGVIARRDDFVRLHGSTFWQACDANSDAAMDAVERQAEMIERNIAAAQARGVVCE